MATNDPKHQQFNLILKGDVKVQVEAAPSPVAFGNVKHGNEESRQVVITDAMGDKNFKIDSISHSSKDIKVTHRPRSQEARRGVTVTLLNTMPAGPLTTTW